MSIHAVKREQYHLSWDNSIPPVITIDSGDTVTFSCLDASNGQVSPSSTHATISSLDVKTVDQVNGPVFVRGAKPGNVLRVDVISVTPGPWGWTALIPGFGLLADEFSEARLKIWQLQDVGGADPHTWFNEKKIRIPLRPFAGEMGVARGDPGQHSTIPPYVTGGNLDTKHLTMGSTLYLPVEVEGALFSIGDGHAAQGDGEVCGTAIETPMEVTVRLTVHPSIPQVTSPHFITTTPISAIPTSTTTTGERYYCTTGVGPDLREAARVAVRAMIVHLGAAHGLGREDAYMLCSVAGDLRLHEVVDMPNYVVGMMMPLSIFVGPEHGSTADTVGNTPRATGPNEPEVVLA